VDLASLAGRLAAAGDVTANEYLVRFRAPDSELVVFEDGRAIVKGVKDVAQARSVYARYVGS
jgi:adenylyltransferase/sulfurtransferase